MSLLSSPRGFQVDELSVSLCGEKIRLLLKLTLRITHFFSRNFGNFPLLIGRISTEMSRYNKLGIVSISFCIGVRLGLAH